MIRNYHNHKPQTNPTHKEEEPHNHHETPGRQTKQSNQLSLTHQDDSKTRMDIKQCTTKHRTITDSHKGSNNKQKVNNLCLCRSWSGSKPFWNFFLKKVFDPQIILEKKLILNMKDYTACKELMNQGLTLKAPITTFPIFEKKSYDISWEKSCLICNFWKRSKFLIVVCCKLKVALYGLWLCYLLHKWIVKVQVSLRFRATSSEPWLLVLMQNMEVHEETLPIFSYPALLDSYNV